ncbi:MAG: hypothetical protein ACJAUD_002723 [Crocinitomicaceae bacterium]|jgi:hypothetical protein
MNYFKSLLLLLVITFNSAIYASTPPDEGMWLPLLLKDYNYAEMQRLGCKLTPEQIYSVNNSSIKDAIVQLGGFCTAEVVSNEGLMLTNHHCAYDAIASQSSEENNYLRDGFWAMNKGEELAIPGLTVQFLLRIEDVTDRIKKRGNKAGEDMADMEMLEEIEKIIAEAIDGTSNTAEVKEMFDGNAHYLFIYETFTDIRLVGAPPSAVGKFGGDTDNWMWPRHTGDFSMLRIYAGTDNKPADYNENNKPYTPKHFLPVSTSGLSEGDFTMVMGYPGTTDRYLTSFEIDQKQNVDAPIYIDVLGKRLQIMKGEMDKDESVKIANASSYASLANTHKYFKGQLRGLNKFDLSAQRKLSENEFTKWVNETPERIEKYGEVLQGIKDASDSYKRVNQVNAYVNMAGFAPDFVSYGIGAWRLKRMLEASSDEARIKEMTDEMSLSLDEHFETYNIEMERKILIMALDFMKNSTPEGYKMDLFESDVYLKKAKGSNERFADLILKKSILTDSKRMNEFLGKPSLKTLEKDAGIAYVESIISLFRTIQPGLGMQQMQLASERELYMEALQEQSNTKNFYPDANFTMRVTYGTVKTYDSWEGKKYETFTYGSQILDKYKAGDSEFDVPEKLRTLLKNKDYGPYANADGKLPVCFLHNTDITGGNSGSPVINGNGELVGIAFDGNWESMTSDLYWQDDYVRTISVDIRYVMFIIDKYAGASHLIKEMKLVD